MVFLLICFRRNVIKLLEEAVKSDDAIHTTLAGDTLNRVVRMFFEECACIFQSLLVNVDCTILTIAAILDNLAQSVLVNIKQIA